MILSHMTPLQQRLIISIVSTILVLISIYLLHVPAFKPIFTIAIASAIAVAAWEFYHIAIGKGLQPAAKLGITLGILYTISTALSAHYPAAETLPAIVLLASLLSCFLYFFSKGSSPFMNLPVTIFAITYLFVPLSCMIFIAYYFTHSSSQDGRWWLFYLLAVTKMTDTGGFFIGKQFGKQKLAPYISPKKTWEGALGGLFSAIVASVIIKILAALFDPNAFGLTFLQSLWLGAGIGVIAQFGDLAESLLKRDGGVKDSSHIPGLGGVLDIVDSLVFTAPLVYIFLRIYAEP